MIQYVLECIAFQLLFLIIYDFFLKKETFFQWNRAYLLVTYALSLLLPWVKIEAFSTELPATFQGYSDFLWSMEGSPVIVATTLDNDLHISWQQVVFVTGIVIATFWFLVKLWRLYQLRRKGEVTYFKHFTQIVLPHSNEAFSFFRSIFLGDEVLKKEYNVIVYHELVHIRQRHSLDLLFFELMRIVGWFNPLVYIYQQRITELHEFIADDHVPKTERKAHYNLLLSQVFESGNISFVNHFFKNSLIKKRIVMLQKTKSKKVWQLKYLLLVPLVLGMLFYTSCEQNDKEGLESTEGTTTLQTEMGAVSFAEIDEAPVFPNCEDADDKKACFSTMLQQHISKNFSYPEDAQELGLQGRVHIMFTIDENGSVGDIKKRGPHFLLEDEAERIISKLPQMEPAINDGKPMKMLYSIPISFRLGDGVASEVGKTNYWIDKEEVPFSYVDNVPVFPGCEDNSNARACFNMMMQRHISKNFNYPEEAKEKGIQGRVSVMFTVASDGSIINIRKRGPHELLENEVERIIKKLPKMTPGNYNGKNVDVPYSIPVTFKLS